ncbi:MAG: hypothetical protein AAF802_10895 [Planctomycetota bacterium]
MQLPSRILRQAILLGGVLWLTIAAGGCRSTRPSIRLAHQAYLSGDLPVATETLSSVANDSSSLRTASELDLAIVELAGGQSSSAESRLRALRDRFDAQTELSIKDAASFVSDDRVREFSLAAYEDVVLRTMLAVCSLSSGSGDAGAYLLQAQQRQIELAKTLDESEDGPKYATHVALAPYLRGAIREATHQDYDDAERSFRLVSQIEPGFLPASEDIRRANQGQHSPKGHGVVYVISFVGEGPRRIETIADTTTASLQIASTLIRSARNDSDDDNEPVLPNIASVKVPRTVVPDSPLAAIGVRYGSQFLGATQTVTHVGRLAVDQCEAEMPWTIARAVARRVLKEASVAAVSDSVGLNGTAASLFEFAASSAWSGIEKADTRGWTLLPREFQVLRAALPAGHHTLELVPLGFGGDAIAPAVLHSVEIEDGRNSFAFVFAPTKIVSVVDAAR